MEVGKFEHTPVLFNEVLQNLNVKQDGVYIDATFGRGGHSRGILAKLGSNGKLVAIDQDPVAVAAASEIEDQRFHIEHAAFTDLISIAEKYEIKGQVNGILLDLGVSSPQLDDAERGFSFMHDGPLDMRMNTTSGMNAQEWIQVAKEEEIATVLKTYGEERYAKRIARAIVQARDAEHITTTGRLADIIKHANPAWEKHKHPATRSFQAIRLFLNKELESLSVCLEQCIDVLAVGGRLVVISFHSLEDRIVKRFIRRETQGAPVPKHIPIKDEAIVRRLSVVHKKITPGNVEVTANPRARSAVMRVAEKIT